MKQLSENIEYIYIYIFKCDQLLKDLTFRDLGEVLTPSYVNSTPLSFSHAMVFEASASTIAVRKPRQMKIEVSSKQSWGKGKWRSKGTKRMLNKKT